MPFFERELSASETNMMYQSAEYLASHGNRNRSGNRSVINNVSIRTTNATNTWWRRDPMAYQATVNISNTLVSRLNQNTQKDIYSTLVLIRNVKNITQPYSHGPGNQPPRSYVERQTLHINQERTARYGDAFVQIIYYLDTPKYTNTGRNANNANRGTLILRNGRNTINLVPKKGRAVYFTPDDTLHHVAPPSGNERRIVNRLMVIMMLYKKPSGGKNVSKQLRNYTPGTPRVLEALVGHNRAPSVPSKNNRKVASNLANRMGGFRL
jgi:hypothetical protein